MSTRRTLQSDLAAQVDVVGDLVERHRARGGTAPLDPKLIQELFLLAVWSYGANYQDGIREPPLPADADVSPTDVIASASALLKFGDIEAFELTLWEAWSGRQDRSAAQATKTDEGRDQ